MSNLNSTVATITQNELLYAPAVLAGVQAAEAVAADAPGHAKADAVLTGIMTGSAALATNKATPPSVAGIAALINLSVSILNALGIFRKAAPAKSGLLASAAQQQTMQDPNAKAAVASL